MKLKQLLEQLNQLAKKRPEALEMEVYGEETEYKFEPIKFVRFAIIGKEPETLKFGEVINESYKGLEYKIVIIIE